MNELIVRTRAMRVASDTDDCLVLRKVVERTHPHAKRWIRVDENEDAQASYDADVKAHQLAIEAGLVTDTGHARWNVHDGPVWVECFAEGEKWTPIEAGSVTASLLT